MPQQLTRVLIENGVVSEETLNEALQRQVIFGGSLDTNLAEVSSVTEEALLAALGATTGLPTADRAQIDQIGEHIPRLFPLVFAETYHLVPFRLAEQELLVLLNQAPDSQLFERIGERLRLKAGGVVTTEVRLHYAMHRLYGTALLPRFGALLKRLDGDVPESATASSEHVLSWGLSSAVIKPTQAQNNEQRRSLDVRGVLARLDAATDRDSIVEALLGATLAVFDFAGLFAVHGDLINGWRGPSPEATQRLARISLNVELPSVFQTIYVTGGHYLGPLPPNSINTKLQDDMGRSMPRAALLAPLSIGGKLAAILYADNGPRGVSSKRVAAVLLLAQRAGMAFERLIRRQKSRPNAVLEDMAGESAHLDFGSMTISAEGESWVVHDVAPTLRTEPRCEPLAQTPSAANSSGAGDSDRTGHAHDAELNELNATPEPSADATHIAPVTAAAGHQLAMAPSPARSSEPWGTVRLSELEGAEVSVDISDEIVLEPEGEGDEETAAEPLTATAPAADPAMAAKPAADAAYTMFADVSDSPKEALEDWQDVLIETAGLDGSGRVSNRRAQNAPPSVTWDDVIAEAERAQSSVTSNAAVEVAGTVIDTRELLYDSLDAQNPEVRHDAIEKLLALGTSIDEEIRQRFPGRLTHDPFVSNNSLPPFRACSGLLELIAARGASAAPVVLPHLESPQAVCRLFAIYYLFAVPYPPALGALTRRLYDAEPKNRFLAAETLRVYAHDPGYAPIVQGLRDQLRVPILESQVAAVQILGQLREPTAVPSLIPLVVAKRSELAGAAASALAVICGQSFGNDVARWAEWWQSHYNRPRPLWLIESLRHAGSAVARLAHNELVLLSGANPPTDLESATGREQATVGWEAWWSQMPRHR